MNNIRTFFLKLRSKSFNKVSSMKDQHFLKLLNSIKANQTTIKLNLGCGQIYKAGWINIDKDDSVKTDINADIIDLNQHFSINSVDLVYMTHSISYLNLWQARSFFKDVFNILKDDGLLEIEFPDIVKCAQGLTKTKSDFEFIEAVRGIYAFDLDQVKNEEFFTPYAFGWTGWFIKIELEKAGFHNVQILNPETHGKRIWRDTRIIASK